VNTTQASPETRSEVPIGGHAADGDTGDQQPDHQQEHLMPFTLQGRPRHRRSSDPAALQKIGPKPVATSLDTEQAHGNVPGEGFLDVHTLTDQTASPNELSHSATPSTPKWADQPMSAAATPDELDRRIDEAGFDSFPASDPPSWWAGPTTTT
jgi:hypothetical protein